MATDVYVICFSDDQIFSKLINTFKNSELLNIYSDFMLINVWLKKWVAVEEIWHRIYVRQVILATKYQNSPELILGL